MTEKENYLKVLNGEKAERVPNFAEVIVFFRHFRFSIQKF